MSRTLVWMLAAAAVALAGCGASSGADGGDGDEVAAVNRVVAAYGRALADGDGERACSLMTSAARAREVRVNREIGVRECRDMAALISVSAPEDERREFRALRLGSVRVDGDRAIGRLVGLHALVRSYDTSLRRVHGHWLIDVPRAD